MFWDGTSIQKLGGMRLSNKLLCLQCFSYEERSVVEKACNQLTFLLPSVATQKLPSKKLPMVIKPSARSNHSRKKPVSVFQKQQIKQCMFRRFFETVSDSLGFGNLTKITCFNFTQRDRILDPKHMNGTPNL